MSPVFLMLRGMCGDSLWISSRDTLTISYPSLVFSRTPVRAYRLVSKMWCDGTKFILDFQWRVKELVHELECLLLIIKKSTSVDALEIDLEKSLILAALQQLLEFLWLLGKQTREVNGLHGIDRHLAAVPLHCLRDF